MVDIFLTMTISIILNNISESFIMVSYNSNRGI
uniref:Uncharacterized protein n=1 Tax=Rhizophora mucronata TaxID=61149 RepID=A0A2P2PR50_RHIMU